MSSFLATFGGKFGDILWSMSTVKRLSEIVGVKADFAIMPQYESLLPLLQDQPYIDNAFVDKDWIMMHSNFGDQPWNPQSHTQAGCFNGAPVTMGAFKCRLGWQYCWHLGYRSHPGLVMGGAEKQLIDFIAWQLGITLPENPLPFIAANDHVNVTRDIVFHDQKVPIVTYAFNSMYEAVKEAFMLQLCSPAHLPEIMFLDVASLPWVEAAAAIKHAIGHVGDRSANYVIAHGVAQRMFIFEPHPARNAKGHLGYVFGCRYGREVDAPLNATVEEAVQMAVAVITEWTKENKDANVNAVAR